ncbi:KICSTOR complex protein SZT2-like [Watersipora subatra]|uniref:KICSTOR complex protein SZT2-like n=1 Tax=Watersipora subatra TaxID=2589382 RepID=UPI00355B3906
MEDNSSKSLSNEVVVAETVFLLMTKEHRISKHLRAKWYLKHVNKVLEFPYVDDSVGHPQLVSVLVNGGKALRRREDGRPVKFKLATDTTVNFLSTHHDLVFAIDVSFSTISSSTADSEVLFDKMYSSFKECVIGLTKTFIIPGSDGKVFVPYLYATVIAYSPLNDCPVQQVLTHGYLVSHYNVGEFIQFVSQELNRFENGVANYMRSILQERCATVPQYDREEDRRDSANSAIALDEPGAISKLHLGPERGFFHLIKNAMLAIHLLPTNCSSGIIVITDGSVGIGDVGRFDNLLVQLLSQSCTCSVIEVGCENNLKRGLGRVPHSEMLQFIATATFGAYFTDTPSMEEDSSKEMNLYHEGILCWDFKKSIKDFLSIGPTTSCLSYESKLRKRWTEYALTVPINCVITTRMKEGFTIKTVDASEDGIKCNNYRQEIIEVVMVLPWRKNVCIEYKASSPWPVPAHKPVTSVSICFEGNYHFLHDLTCKKAHIRANMSPRYRQALVSKFWKSILSLRPIDESLVKIQAFHTQDEFSTIPESIKKGVALFYCPTVRDGQSLDIINHSDDASMEQFTNYWHRVLCIDLGVPLDKSGVAFDRSSHIMEKWFHITRLYMVLEHDPRHPEMLNIADCNDRFQTLQCRQATVTLTNALRDWSDFELLERSHYVKYIHRQNNDSTPISGYHAENWQSFCMIMLNVKGACVTLRLTFLGGTDSIYRTRLIEEMKEMLQGLHFQKRPEKASKHSKRHIRGSGQNVPPLQREWEERQCCIHMTKPLDRVLVRYERVPKTILTVDDINHDIAPMDGVASRLANYLHHQRWVWYLQPSDDNNQFDSLDIKSIGNILDVVTKLRLQEGFNFSQTNSGIVSMILEVDMTNVTEGAETQIPKEDQESLSCLVQYITFPPQRRARLQDGSSESDGEDEILECGELVMVTEVWIEPQHGFVANSTPERLDYDGCTFYNWPDKVFPKDERCITLLVTLDHLLKHCYPLSRASMSSSLVSGRREKLSPQSSDDADASADRVKQVPFVFSVLKLLPMCQQVETLFPSYSAPEHAEEGTASAARKTNDILFHHLITELENHPNAFEMDLVPEECIKFMKQLQDRPRSDTTDSLPFLWTPQVPTGSAPNTDRDDMTARSERAMANTLDSPASTLPRGTLPSSMENPPDLKCYCIPGSADKHGVVDSVTMLFMPSSYKNLQKMCSKTPSSESKKEEMDVSEEDATVPPLNIDGIQADSDNRCLPLPIYMYYCSRKLLVDCLLYQTREFIKADEYIDKRFASQADGCSSREYKTSYRSDESDRTPSSAHRRRYRTDSGGYKHSFSRATSMEMPPADTSAAKLGNYCEEAFCKSFITGIFQSLQRGCVVSRDDVEFAIEICMDAGLLEIEITDFLTHVCSHMTAPPMDGSADQVFADNMPTTPKSVKFEIEESASKPLSSDVKPKKSSSASSDGNSRPSNLRSPITLKIPCAALFDRKCETVVSAELIKRKFSHVINKWFKPVPSQQDVFYYSPTNLQNRLSTEIPVESEDADFLEAGDDDTGKEKGFSRSVSEASKDSMAVVQNNMKPLFVHLTASFKSERVFQSVADIPVCLCELEDVLKNMDSIDLANASITLDIICLTLPSEQGDITTISEKDEDSSTETRDSMAAIADPDMKHAVSPAQYNDVLECKKHIEWLVKDEIAAAMRSISPITEETLCMVAEHVKNGQNENPCKYAEERLDYVFGPEMSHDMFLQEFERINVTGYQLIKCGDYYYLSLDRARLKTLTAPTPTHYQLEDVASKLGEMNAPDVHFASCDSPVEIPNEREEFAVSTMSNVKYSMENTSHLHENGFEPFMDLVESQYSQSKEMNHSDSNSNNEATDIEEVSGGQCIPASAPPTRETLLNSLPQRNQIDEWERDDEEFASKCGSLPKALSFCNINSERGLSEKKRLKRVSSGPQELHSIDCKPKIRHFSEDTGRKKTTFAANVLSPPTSNNIAVRELSELESARSRNPSGPWTPISNRFTGSTGSGYEADFSDEEGTGEGISLIGTDIVNRSPQMPNLWLIMQVHADDGHVNSKSAESGPRLARADVDSGYSVRVYYHTSETLPSERSTERYFSGSLKGNVPQAKLFNHVLSEIRRTCKLVNQRLLLKDLHNKRKCDVLLEENTDDELNTEHRIQKKTDQTDSDGEHKSDDEYLYARTKFKQGHFKCELKWEKVFHLHPRLKGDKGKTVKRGLAALRSGLSNLRITNRSNMFVHKERQTESIFYLRLAEANDSLTTPRIEYGDEPRHISADIHPTAILSRSPSISRTREESDNSRRPSVTDNDDTHSISSSRASCKRIMADEGVKLLVYGIDDVGSDIKVDLVRMLEARLDETVMVEIEKLLSRNPNCMLTPLDVQFLQKAEPPPISLKFTLPDKVLHHQAAILHYLRQNLLLPDLLYHPKYQDPVHGFLDYTESLDNAPPMLDSDTFLYNKSPAYANAEKGAGLALIYLQLVDSMNKPKHLISCPPPAEDAWRSLDKSMFSELTSVHKVESEEPSKPLSTSSFVRFSIWSRGVMDLQVMENQLKTSLVHSLCDLVCEFYAFTAPLCEPPPQLQKDLADLIAQEEQHSYHNNRGVEAAPNTPTKKLLSRSKSAAASAFSFNIDQVKTRTQITSPPCYAHGSERLTSGSSDIASKKASILADIDKYLFGQKGSLLPFYTTTLIDWLEFCSQLGMPAMTKISCGLLNDCIVDPVMKEFESVVAELSGVSVQTYKLCEDKYLPYQTSRAPIPESVGAQDGGLFTHLNFTYSDLSHEHILTVRNRKLWKDSVGGERSRAVLTPQSNASSSMSKSNQKFQPAYAGMEGSLSLSNSQTAFGLDRQLLPRQQFLMLVIKNGELTLYSYNLADAKDDILRQHIILNVKKVTRWNNARFHLINSIAHQKMGLFQHVSIQNIPKELHCEEKNPYTSTFEDTVQLAKSSRPTNDSVKTLSNPRPGSRFTKPASAQLPVAALDKVYRGCKPTRPMHLSKGGLEKDPIARHGNQLIETHKNELRDSDRKKKLDKLYRNWLERVGPMRTEISEDHLDLLKQSSRLVHHIATPLLLSPHWRTRAINLPKTIEELQKMEEDNTITSMRSRNNSGASVGSVKMLGDRSIPRESPISQAKGYEEEAWHEEMRNAFVSSYIDYLGQTQQPLGQLGFTTIKITKPSSMSRFTAYHRKHSSGGAGTEQLVRKRTTDSLQKTMPGGIFIIELSFQEVYFVVKLYVFSASQLSLNKQPQLANRNPISYFIDMCDRMRDNTHCHSFAHDFHLKAVHKYVKGCKDSFYPPKEFHKTYHLVRMLKDFAMFYEEAPRFSRNALALKVLQLESTNNPCDKLYEHILLRDTHNQMTKIAMADEDSVEAESLEYGLVYQQSNRRYGEYEVSVIIAHDHPQSFRHMAIKDKLTLVYFVVLVNVNKEQQYPGYVPLVRGVASDNYLVDISRLETLSSNSSVSSSSRRQIRMFSTRWTHGPCTLTYTDDQSVSSSPTREVLCPQHPTYQLLTSQCKAIKDRLTKLVEEASLQCRKQELWKRMQSDQGTQLSYVEFKELLDQIYKQRLSLDERLEASIYSMPVSWFIALTKVLSVKHPKLYREIAHPDELLKHALLLIPDREDVAILLNMDIASGQSELMLLENEVVAHDEVLCKALEDFVNTLCFHMWSQMSS